MYGSFPRFSRREKKVFGSRRIFLLSLSLGVNIHLSLVQCFCTLCPRFLEIPKKNHNQQKIMQRRNFVKKSVAAAIVAATPLALTGLVRADGGGGTGSTSTDSTDWWGSTVDSTIDSTPDGSSTTEDWFQTTLGYSNGPCATKSLYGNNKWFSKWIAGSDGTETLMQLHCFRVYICKDANGQIMGNYRGPYILCEGAGHCGTAENCDSTHMFANLSLCPI